MIHTRTYVCEFKLLFSHQVVSKLLQPHGLQQPRLPCPLSPRIHSNSCPLYWWCHLSFSSSVAPFSSCPQSFPASRSFPMSRLFSSASQIARASASVFSMNIQSWFPLGCLVWCPCWRRDSQESYPMRQIKSINFPLPSLLYFQLSHLYMTTGTTIALTIGNFVGNVMSLLFNMLSRFVIAFLSQE